MHDLDAFLHQLSAIAKSGTPTNHPTPAIALMITRRQRALLKERGFSDEAVAVMKPAEAHRHLGL